MDIAQIFQMARQLEAITSRHNMHVALTGGYLYRDGARKDVDFVIYRAGGHPCADREMFREGILRHFTGWRSDCEPHWVDDGEGMGDLIDARRVWKFHDMCNNIRVDLIFPEWGGSYEEGLA